MVLKFLAVCGTIGTYPGRLQSSPHSQPLFLGPFVIIIPSIYEYPTAEARWLRYCATNQEVAGSIPDGAMEFFIDLNPSDRTMALG
jgi:hypothetical protein